MSIADTRRVITLENRVIDLAERNRVLASRITVLADHLADFEASGSRTQREQRHV